MRRFIIPIVLVPAFMVGCSTRANKTVGTVGTLAELRDVRPDLQEVKVDQGLDQAIHHYRRQDVQVDVRVVEIRHVHRRFGEDVAHRSTRRIKRVLGTRHGDEIAMRFRP